MLDPVVIGQDEGTELHVQAVIQGGRRHLDIRIWRRGPTGFAPSRNAITLEATDLDALQDGITELLEASNNGRDVARVVWDKDEGRRLRAETEPFGTRFMARLGFWQRVRDSWKPAGDGLVLAADQLRPLQALLRDIRPRLESDAEPLEVVVDTEEDEIGPGPIPWPQPGGDWLTVEGERLAFHPRGIRVTADVRVHDGEHSLVLHQWERRETLWLTSDRMLELTLSDLDAVLGALRELNDDGEDTMKPGDQLPLSDGSTLWVRVLSIELQPELHLDRLPPPSDSPIESGYEPIIVIPAAHLPRFGRTLWQARSLLVGRLAASARKQLMSLEEIEAIAVDPPTAETPIESEPIAESREASPGSLQPTIEDRKVDHDHDSWVDTWKPPKPSEPPQRRSIALGSLKLGHDHVFLFLQEGAERALFLQWEGRSLQLPVENLEEMLSRIRDLYYGTLRGRRGHAVIIGTRPPVTVSVHHHGATSYLALDQELNGRITHLSFPTNQVPAFLNIAEAALAKI